MPKIELIPIFQYDLTIFMIPYYAVTALKKSLFLVSCFGSALITVACGHQGVVKPDMEDAKFWQRKSVSSALYLQGPKAQQQLHQDISRCVREISELENLGEIRRAVPTNYQSGNMVDNRTDAQKNLDRHDTPQRDGYLYHEHLDYYDFETCMNANGWERVEYLPGEVADEARQNYLDRMTSKRKRSKSDRENVTTLHPESQDPPPFKNLNE